MGVQHAKFECKEPAAHSESAPTKPPGSPKNARGDARVERTATVNMDMFKEAFALFDKDESGDIDQDEMAQVLTALGQHLTKYVTGSQVVKTGRKLMGSSSVLLQG
jgi:hypothetical protein